MKPAAATIVLGLLMLASAAQATPPTPGKFAGGTALHRREGETATLSNITARYHVSKQVVATSDKPRRIAGGLYLPVKILRTRHLYIHADSKYPDRERAFEKTLVFSGTILKSRRQGQTTTLTVDPGHHVPGFTTRPVTVEIGPEGLNVDSGDLKLDLTRP